MNHNNYNDDEVTVSNLSKILNIPYETLQWRIKNGWNMNELSMPINLNNKNIRKKELL